ncbi:AfsR/SARP family transcriptional regulator [Amycolatopsis albispora]|uniref:OmpR/PhoB-type domain-containing protein n=1 Tax=Amycolatopsis albispora TaxID=1804986 RepID=A0A344L357_9PSEU|nr:BTAD domain-containing putative transcriptional regulator [Amycolatopsis albispora]AXB42481.1 hypothetical protein A4R43_08040 [Amycolatopsis albispora]
MEFEVLGTIRLRDAGRDAMLAGRLRRTLLGVLLANANRVVPAGVLTEAMWGDQRDDRVVRNLHTHVHRLRGVFTQPDRLRSEQDGYLLTVLPGELDAERFETLIEDGVNTTAHDPRRGAELIREALGIWRGAPFGGLDVPVLHDEARRLGEQRLRATEELYTAELAAGRHTAVIAELTELVARYPLRERLHGLLMTALYRGGQQAGALAAYRSARAVVVEELGQEPGPELRQLEQRILAGEPIDTEATARQATPAQLPYDVRGFSGREAELATLDELTPGALVAVVGEGGVGKTALAVRWAHRARERFPDGQLYVDLRGYGPDEPMAPGDVLTAFLRELGMDGSTIPPGLPERAARLRTLVDGRRLLMVLDNARTVEQVRPLLPGGASCSVVVTSRDSLAGLVAREGAHRVRLGRLPYDEALALFRGLVGDRPGTAAGTETALIERCARLPLALRIAAEQVNARPCRNLDDLLSELAGKQAVLDLLDAGGDRHTAVRTVFSWSYQRLSPDAQRLFRLFGLHPGKDVDACALAALADAGHRATRSLVDALLRAHLVEEVAPGRFQLHDLLSAYAADLVASTDRLDEREAALTRLLDHYHHTARAAVDQLEQGGLVPESPVVSTPEFESAAHALRWLDAERENLVRAARFAVRQGRPYATMHLGGVLFRYLSSGAHHQQALVLYQDALMAAREQHDVLEEGHANRYLGAVHYRLGHPDTVREHMHLALRCYQRSGAVRYERVQLLNLGVVCTWLGRYQEALGHFAEALARYREAGETEVSTVDGCAGALTNLGRVHCFLGDYEAALAYLTEALALPTGGQDRRNALEAHLNTGIVYSRLGQYERAVGYLERVRAGAAETGNRLLQAGVFPLARVYWRLGRRAEAFDCIKNCLAVVRGTGDRLAAASVLTAFGDLYREAGSPAEAMPYYREGLAVAEAIGKPYERGRALAGIGYASADLGDEPVAVTHWLEALRVFEALGVPETAEVRARLAF